MLAAFLLAVFQSGVGYDAELALVASRETEEAHWEVSGGPFEVGEPFEATLVVGHAPGAKVELDAASLERDTSWLAHSAPQLVRTPGEVRASLATTRWTWQLASFEPGERDLPAVDVTVEHDGATAPLKVEAARITFEGVLGADEDEPRPLIGFRPLEPERAASVWTWAAGGAAFALLGVLATWWLWRSRRRAQAVAPPTTLERIDTLARRDLDDPLAVRALHFELTATLRRHYDALDGAVSRRAMTDEEWLAAVATQRPALVEPLGELFTQSREVKYGGRVPTAWAVRETVEKSRTIVRATPEQVELSA